MNFGGFDAELNERRFCCGGQVFSNLVVEKVIFLMEGIIFQLYHRIKSILHEYHLITTQSDFLFTATGPFLHKFLRALLPFWSSALPTLPVTAPSQKDSLNGDDGTEGRVRHQKSSRMDPRKILLFIAIM